MISFTRSISSPLLLFAVACAILSPLLTDSTPIPRPEDIIEGNIKPLSDTQLQSMGHPYAQGTSAERAKEINRLGNREEHAAKEGWNNKDRAPHTYGQEAALTKDQLDTQKKMSHANDAQLAAGQKQSEAALKDAAAHPNDPKKAEHAQQEILKSMNAHQSKMNELGQKAELEAKTPFLDKAARAKTPQEAAAIAKEGEKAGQEAKQKAREQYMQQNPNTHNSKDAHHQMNEEVPGYKTSPEVQAAAKKFRDAVSKSPQELAEKDKNGKYHKYEDAKEAVKGYEHAENNHVKSLDEEAKKTKAIADEKQKIADKTKKPEDTRAAELAKADAKKAEAVHRHEAAPVAKQALHDMTKHSGEMIDNNHKQGVHENQAQSKFDAAGKAKSATEKAKLMQQAKTHASEAATHEDKAHASQMKSVAAANTQSYLANKMNKGVVQANQDHQKETKAINEKHGGKPGSHSPTQQQQPKHQSTQHQQPQHHSTSQQAPKQPPKQAHKTTGKSGKRG